MPARPSLMTSGTELCAKRARRRAGERKRRRRTTKSTSGSSRCGSTGSKRRMACTNTTASTSTSSWRGPVACVQVFGNRRFLPRSRQVRRFRHPCLPVLVHLRRSPSNRPVYRLFRQQRSAVHQARRSHRPRPLEPPRHPCSAPSRRPAPDPTRPHRPSVSPNSRARSGQARRRRSAP